MLSTSLLLHALASSASMHSSSQTSLTAELVVINGTTGRIGLLGVDAGGSLTEKTAAPIIPPGSTPLSAAVDPSTQSVYIAYSENGARHLACFATKDGFKRTWTLKAEIQSVVVNARHRFIHAIANGGHILTFALRKDGSPGRLLSRARSGTDGVQKLAVSVDGRLLVVTTSDNMLEVQLGRVESFRISKTGAVTRASGFDLHLFGAVAGLIDERNRHVYVACPSGHLIVFNIDKSGRLLRRISIETRGGLTHAVWSTSRHTIYAVGYEKMHVFRASGANTRLLYQIEVPREAPLSLVSTPSRRLYAYRKSMSGPVHTYTLNEVGLPTLARTILDKSDRLVLVAWPR